ncbi:MAG: hypothetical protein ABIP17_14010 [Ilumatobacteraceae bacterium]
MRFPTQLVVAAGLAISGCGGGSASGPGMTNESIAPTSVESESASPADTIGRIDAPATATTPAQRLDDDVVVAWIGGSDLELDGRSLPSAVSARSPQIAGRSLTIVADVTIGPLPATIRDRVERAAVRNVDALIVPLSPSWLTWNGHDDCHGLTPPHAFYSCILDPAPGTDVTALRAEVADLIDTIVETGIPAYLYVIPHSIDALTDPLLADRLASLDATFTALDPRVDRVTYVGHVVTRDLDRISEGVEFFDMVHPTPVGVERLADFFAAQLPLVLRLTPN